MKTSKQILGLMAAALVAFTSCQKDDVDIQEPVSVPDGAALTSMFENNRAETTQQFTINAATGGTITGTDGTTIYFSPNSFGINGSPVSGSVEVELIEIYDKGSMLLNNKPTMGQRASGVREVLKSAGEFYINAVQGSNQLELLNATSVSSKPFAPSEMDFNMMLFTGGTELNDTTAWKEAGEVGFKDGQGADGGAVTYSFNIGSFGWTNLDRWYSYTGPKTMLYVDVPEGFDGDNCEVYLSYDGEPTALARMDVWSTENGMFTEHYGQIPIGQQVHFILVAEIDGQLHAKIQAATIVDGHIEVMDGLTPISQSDLESSINSLP